MWFKLSVVACVSKSHQYRKGGGGLLDTYSGRDSFSTLKRQAADYSVCTVHMKNTCKWWQSVTS